jgi:aspartate carbamoyltransferase catalytic subunit
LVGDDGLTKKLSALTVTIHTQRKFRRTFTFVSLTNVSIVFVAFTTLKSKRTLMSKGEVFAALTQHTQRAGVVSQANIRPGGDDDITRMQHEIIENREEYYPRYWYPVTKMKKKNQTLKKTTTFLSG